MLLTRYLASRSAPFMWMLLVLLLWTKLADHTETTGHWGKTIAMTDAVIR